MKGPGGDLFHALGNHLNAAILLAEDLLEQTDHSKLAQLAKANALLQSNRNRLPEFFGEGSQGPLLVAYYQELESQMTSERRELTLEMKRLVKELIEMRDLLLSQKERAQT